jgi:hypothetical protein
LDLLGSTEKRVRRKNTLFCLKSRVLAKKQSQSFSLNCTEDVTGTILRIRSLESSSSGKPGGGKMHDKPRSDAVDDASVVANLIGGLVVAGRAAGLAVHQAIGTKPDVDDRLAQAAVLLALALCFRLFALHAAVFGAFGAHAG